MIVVKHVDKNCFRGPRPPDLKDLRVTLNIDTIIDLESGLYDLLNGVAQFPPDFGMAYYHMPCSAVVPPNPAYVAKAIDLMSDLDRHVYIHCKDGVDRTGFVCAAYRMKVQKWTYAEAKAEWIAEGRHPWYIVWEPALKTYSPKEFMK